MCFSTTPGKYVNACLFLEFFYSLIHISRTRQLPLHFLLLFIVVCVRGGIFLCLVARSAYGPREFPCVNSFIFLFWYFISHEKQVDLYNHGQENMASEEKR